MTTYVVSSTQTIGTYNIAIKAGIWEIRMVQINFSSRTGAAYPFVGLCHPPGTTMSGGSAMAVTPTRQNAPAASATAQQGPRAATFSTTPVCVSSTVLPPGAVVSSSGTTTITQYPGANAQMSFVLPTIIAPGGVINFQGFFLDTVTADIYFEELRLTGSY